MVTVEHQVRESVTIGTVRRVPVRSLSGFQHRLTRSRFLGGMGAVVLGSLASGLLNADPALAHYSTPPACCGPSGRCNCCSGSSCCTSGCKRRDSGCGVMGSGWYCCSRNSPYPKYLCSDYWDGDGNGYDTHKCICAGYSGGC